MAKLKICGLKRLEDIEYVNELKPDYIGILLKPGFRRSINRKTASLLKKHLDKDINAVGVFVNDSKENIEYFTKNGIIDTVQLHGNETPEFCKGFDVPVIKYFNPQMFDKINDYDTDSFLFDSGTGTCKTFDWSILPKSKKPFILAGFFCEVDGDSTIRMDTDELKYAEWVNRKEIALQPDDASLTNEMMQQFRDGKITKQMLREEFDV